MIGPSNGIFLNAFENIPSLLAPCFVNVLLAAFDATPVPSCLAEPVAALVAPLVPDVASVLAVAEPAPVTLDKRFFAKL